MNQLAGFTILLFAALLLIVSSVTNVKVIAEGNDSSSEKSTTTAKTCSPEVFKENPGLYATCVALAHNKESAASGEKPVENLNLFSSSPIEVKKGPTIENNPSVPLTGEKLEIKKPTIPHNADLAYDTGARRAIQELAANPGRNVFTTEDIQKACTVVGFAGDEHCKAGYRDTVRNIVLKQHGPEVKPEGPVVCKGPAGTNNGIGYGAFSGHTSRCYGGYNEPPCPRGQAMMSGVCRPTSAFLPP